MCVCVCERERVCVCRCVSKEEPETIKSQRSSTTLAGPGQVIKQEEQNNIKKPSQVEVKVQVKSIKISPCKTSARVVGPGDDLVVVIKLDDGADGTEDFFSHNSHGIRHAREQRGLVQVESMQRLWRQELLVASGVVE